MRAAPAITLGGMAAGLVTAWYRSGEVRPGPVPVIAHHHQWRRRLFVDALELRYPPQEETWFVLVVRHYPWLPITQVTFQPDDDDRWAEPATSWRISSTPVRAEVFTSLDRLLESVLWTTLAIAWAQGQGLPSMQYPRYLTGPGMPVRPVPLATVEGQLSSLMARPITTVELGQIRLPMTLAMLRNQGLKPGPAGA